MRTATLYVHKKKCTELPLKCGHLLLIKILATSGNSYLETCTELPLKMRLPPLIRTLNTCRGLSYMYIEKCTQLPRPEMRTPPINQDTLLIIKLSQGCPE